MNLNSSYWMRLSKKLIGKIDNPRSAGSFTESEAKARGMRLVIGKDGSIQEGNALWLYLLVDESDGIISDAKFQVFGEPALIGAGEIACEILLRRNYDQARRISAELIDKQARDKSDIPAFPDECGTLLNKVIFAIDEAALQCMDIPVEDIYVATPISNDTGEATQYPGWETLNDKQKIAVIEAVIAEDIRPYIELDAGNVTIVDFVEGKEVIIAYQGACTTCISSTGSTLTAIQQILRTKVHPSLTVTPDLSSLSH